MVLLGFSHRQITAKLVKGYTLGPRVQPCMCVPFLSPGPVVLSSSRQSSCGFSVVITNSQRSVAEYGALLGCCNFSTCTLSCISPQSNKYQTNSRITVLQWRVHSKYTLLQKVLCARMCGFPSPSTMFWKSSGVHLSV